MNNIPTFTEQAKYIIYTKSITKCPKTDKSVYIYCHECICLKFCCNNNMYLSNIEQIFFCKKYLSDLRLKKLKIILNE